MQRIGYVQETPGDVEAAVLKLTKEEYDELQGGPKEFVNKHKDQIFKKDVTSVVLRPASPQTPSVAQASVSDTTSAATCMLLIIHRPACTCVGTCIPLDGN